jgi:hypothetical protein
VLDRDHVEEPGGLDLLALIGQLGRSRMRRTRGQTLAYGVVYLLDLIEERVAAGGEDVGGAPDSLGGLPAAAHEPLRGDAPRGRPSARRLRQSQLRVLRAGLLVHLGSGVKRPRQSRALLSHEPSLPRAPDATLGAGTVNGHATTDKPKAAAAPDLTDCDSDRAASRPSCGA